MPFEYFFCIVHNTSSFSHNTLYFRVIFRDKLLEVLGCCNLSIILNHYQIQILLVIRLSNFIIFEQILQELGIGLHLNMDGSNSNLNHVLALLWFQRVHFLLSGRSFNAWQFCSWSLGVVWENGLVFIFLLLFFIFLWNLWEFGKFVSLWVLKHFAMFAVDWWSGIILTLNNNFFLADSWRVKLLPHLQITFKQVRIL